MRLVFVRRGGAEKAIERFLKQIVRELTIARDAGEIRPYAARGPLVERAESILVHHKTRGGSSSVSARLTSVKVMSRNISETSDHCLTSRAERFRPKRRCRFDQTKPLRNDK